MNTVCFDLVIRMASPAHECGSCLKHRLAPKYLMRVFFRCKIGMTLRTSKRMVDGGLELLSVYVGLDEFFIFECQHEPVLRMTR